MKLSKHFRTGEFVCKHCRQGTVHPHLIALLELVRHHFKKPIYINSGYRCASHNVSIGGAPKSFHLSGSAVDFFVEDTSPQAVADFLREVFPNDYGIEDYPTFVHIDLGEKRTWRG